MWEHPANPFVFNFLGNVTLFHGRVHEGQAKMGPLAVEAPEHAGASDAPAIGYVRPYDLEVLRHKNGGTSIEAELRHVSLVGPFVRLEMKRRDNGGYLEAAISRDQYSDLGAQVGESLYVKPKKLKVFVDEEDYVI